MRAVKRRKGPSPGAGNRSVLAGDGLRWGLAVVVVLWSFAAFSPSLRNGFVDWDDYQNLRDNEHVRSFSPENVKWMLTAAHLGVWQPVAWTVTALEYGMFGGDEESFSRGMHGANILLHALASVLALFLIRSILLHAFRMRGKKVPPSVEIAAASSALLFAVHPLRVELVAWATAQPYILAVIFLLASALFYLEAAESGERKPLLLSWAFFALSLMSKSIGVPLVPLLLLLDAYPLRRFGGGGRTRAVLLEKVPYALLAGAVIVVAPLAKGSAGSTMSFDVHGPAARAGQACYGLVFYLWKSVIPTGLSPIYELRLPLRIADPKYVVSIGLVAAAALLAALLFRSKRRAVPVALLAYGLLLFPVLGFLQSGNQEVADRYAYLPLVPLHVLLAALFHRIFRGDRRGARAAGGAVVLLAALLSILTARQCGVWRDTASLWTRAAELQPYGSVAQNGYGFVLLEEGRTEEAIELFRRAIAVKGDNEMAHRNLWSAFRAAGRSDDLIGALRETTRLMPDFAEAHHHLGNERARRKEYDLAAASFRRALAIDPNLALSHRSLAGVLYSSGDREGAKRHARAALELDPGLPDARTVLASCLRDEGRMEEARSLLREGLRIDPADRALRIAIERLGGSAR